MIIRETVSVDQCNRCEKSRMGKYEVEEVADTV